MERTVYLLTFLSFLVIHCKPYPLPAQDYTAVDAHARSYHYTRDYNKAAIELTEPFNTPEEKVRAIFIWIAHNIEYDTNLFDQFLKTGVRTSQSFSANSPEELERQRQAYLEERMERTLQRRKGVCTDFSLLLQGMCRAVGIETEYISGISRGSHHSVGSRDERYYHSWNAVKLDGRWRLLDVTWSAEMDASKGFTLGYFLTDPKLFIHNHYPDSVKWQLLEEPVSYDDFFQLAFLHRGFIEYGGQSLSPGTAIIPKSKATTFEFRFEEPIDGKLAIIEGDNPMIVESRRKGNTYTVQFKPSRAVPGLISFGLARPNGRIEGLITYKAK